MAGSGTGAAAAAGGEADTYDIAVIGGGPGGYATALYAAAAGLTVAVVERDKVGGTCLHRGCVPAKEFLETAAVRRAVAGASSSASRWRARPMAPPRSGRRLRRQPGPQAGSGRPAVPGVWPGLMKGRGIVTHTGTGRFLGDHRVEITGDDGATTLIRATDVVLAAGSVPRTIPGFDVDGTLVLTSDEVLDLDALPARVAVVGGGAIGCEFASMFSDLGSSVTVLEVLPSILAACDADVAALVARSFRKRGIDVKAGVEIHGHKPGPSGTSTVVSYGDGGELEVDAVVVSVGRRPRTENLVAEGTGVVIDDRGFVVADGYLRTGEPGVWAVGDLVADTPQLAHVGFAEGIVVVKSILGEPVIPVDYGRAPWAIYCHPEVAFAGLTEEAARAAGYDVVTKKDPFGGNSRGPHHRGHRGAGEDRGRTAAGRLHRPDPRGAHGGSLGDRAAGRRIPGRQLGGHPRGGGPVPPTAPVAVGDVRRDGTGPDRKGTPPCLT